MLYLIVFVVEVWFLVWIYFVTVFLYCEMRNNN
nr:hypothetical protein XZYIHYVE_XZYIHYVE_CDS_0008 [Microvirus sp.]